MHDLDLADDRSSSGSILNADSQLDFYQQKLWFYLNVENNMNPDEKLDPNLDIRIFSCDVQAHWHRLADDITPARKLCNLFWLDLPWRALEDRLGPLRIMDYGSSAGNYAINFMQWTDVPFAYHGFDVRRINGWKERCDLHDNLKFTQYEGEFERHHLTDEFNYFMSQAAMEHVIHDLTYFQVIADYLAETRKPAIQIHLIPSVTCLDLYGLHGVRQYSPRTLSKISSMFPDAICTVFCLGGPATNEIHRQAITIPELNKTQDWRINYLDDYNRLMRKAIETDMISNSHDASFYALVIESGVEKSLFGG